MSSEENLEHARPHPDDIRPTLAGNPDPDKHLKAAKWLASKAYNIGPSPIRTGKYSKSEDFYIVMFAFILGGWKAEISTDIEDGLYYEVTYNVAKEEAYIDEYIKARNARVPLS